MWGAQIGSFVAGVALPIVLVYAVSTWVRKT